MTLDELRALATNTRNGFACWPAPYQMSVTLEDAEFLYALVRVTKPGRVLELGTGMGVAARFIAEAIRKNGMGDLVTVEPSDEHLKAAAELLTDLPARVVWTLPSEVGATGPLSPEPELVFIDSDYTRREDDIESFLGRGSAFAGLVVVHDANRRYPGLAQGVGVFLPGSDGLWLGRAKA